MKTHPLAACLLIACLTLNACTITPQRAQQVTQWGNTALTVAQVFGAVKKADAQLVREHGALILGSFTGTATEAKVAAISEAVIDFAEARQTLTPEQIEALRELGTVPLITAPAPLPLITVTASK